MSTSSPLPLLSRNLYREQPPSSPSSSRPFDLPPSHHVLPTSYLSQITSLLPGQDLNGSTGDVEASPRPYVPPSSFRNPWRSWHKPTLNEVWRGLSWRGGSAPSSATEATFPHAVHSSGAEPKSTSIPPPPTSQPDLPTASSGTSPALRVIKPDFTYAKKEQKGVKLTWLGHAGCLVQLPSLDEGQEPVRALFDPIFSARCSPVQYFGPLRSYAPPCSLTDLPPVHLLFISHSHYDHQDLLTLQQLWSLNRTHLRIFVPLGLKSWFVEAVKEWMTPDGGDTMEDAERMEGNCIEMDWWDEVELGGAGSEGNRLKIVCTPAQHGSGRYGLDANTTLWSSWLIERIQVSPTEPRKEKRFRVFFGGDTGFQFHEPSVPGASASASASASRRGSTAPDLLRDGPIEAAPRDGAASAAADLEDETLGSSSIQEGERAGLLGSTSPSQASTRHIYPTCPLFTQLALLYGPPHLSLLPISVGATLSFLKSYDPLPEAFSLFPNIDEGLTGANHMRSRDAVRVLKALRSPGIEYSEVGQEGADGAVGVAAAGSAATEGKTEKQTLREYIVEALPPHIAVRVLSAFEERSISSKTSSPPPPPSVPSKQQQQQQERQRMTAVAIHWGTFVSGPQEVDESLRSLEDACGEFGVRFGRVGRLAGEGDGEDGEWEGEEFLALHHGGSHWVEME